MGSDRNQILVIGEIFIWCQDLGYEVMGVGTQHLEVRLRRKSGYLNFRKLQNNNCWHGTTEIFLN